MIVMVNNVLSIARIEILRLLRNWIFWVGLLGIVGGQLLLDSSISRGRLLIPSSAAYGYIHGVVLIGMFFLPFLIAAANHYDRGHNILPIIYSQPITSYEHGLGKFIGSFSIYLIIVGIGLIITQFIPLYFGKAPYFSTVVIEAVFVYLIPTMFFYSALCFLSNTIVKEILLSSVIPIAYFMISDSLLSPKFNFILRGVEIGTLARGEILPLALKSLLIYNRVVFIVTGTIILACALIIGSRKTVGR